MELLGDLVEGLALRPSLAFRCELGAPFAVAVPEERRHILLYAFASGGSWVALEAGDGAFTQSGDLVLVMRGSAHVLASEPGVRAVAFDELLRSPPHADGAVRHGGTGRGVAIACGRFAFDDSRAEFLLGSLPPLLHLEARSGPGHAWALPLLGALERECRKGEPGHRAIARRLSEILFIRVLRQILARESAFPDLLALIGDPLLGRALRSLHAEPGRDWSLARLASLAGTSRSVFTQRFRERLGTTPMRYLTDRRMQLARELLADCALSVGEVGRRVGYASEAAFNRAFRDVVGEPPGRYRRALTRTRSPSRLPAERARSTDADETPSAR